MHVNQASAHFIRNSPDQDKGVYQLKSLNPKNENGRLILSLSDVDFEDGLFCFYPYIGYIISFKDGIYSLYIIRNGRYEVFIEELNFDGVPIRMACADNPSPIFIGTTNGIYYVDKEKNVGLIEDTEGKNILTLQMLNKILLYSYSGGPDIYSIRTNELEYKESTYMVVNWNQDFSFYLLPDTLLVLSDVNEITGFVVEGKSIRDGTTLIENDLNKLQVLYAYRTVGMATWALVLLIIFSCLPAIIVVLYIIGLLIFSCFKLLIIPGISALFKKIKYCCTGRTPPPRAEAYDITDSTTTDTTNIRPYELNNSYNSEEMRVINENKSESESKSLNKCKECNSTEKPLAVIIPCEHECLCLECGERYRDNNRPCPTCGQEVETVWPK